MSKYEFDGSDYENWKPSDFPVGYVCQKGVPLRIAIPAAGVQIVLYGIPKNAPIACFAGCIAPIHLSRLKMVR